MWPSISVSRLRSRRVEMQNKRSTICFLAILLIAGAGKAFAQSTIFNIPTTDTVSRGKAYFEFDFLPQIPKPDLADRLYIYDPRLVVGLGPNLEAGINVASYHTSGMTNVFA